MTIVQQRPEPHHPATYDEHTKQVRNGVEKILAEQNGAENNCPIA